MAAISASSSYWRRLVIAAQCRDYCLTPRSEKQIQIGTKSARSRLPVLKSVRFRRIADDHDAVATATTTKEVGIRSAAAPTSSTTRSVNAVLADRIAAALPPATNAADARREAA